MFMTFYVTLPSSKEHIPADRIKAQTNSNHFYEIFRSILLVDLVLSSAVSKNNDDNRNLYYRTIFFSIKQ